MRLGIHPTLPLPLPIPEDYEERFTQYAHRGCIGPILRGALRGFAVSGDELKSTAIIEIVRQHDHLVMWSSGFIYVGRTTTVDPATRFIAEDDDYLFWRLTDWRERRERGESVVVNMRLELPTEDPLIAVARRAVEDSSSFNRHDEALRRLLAREERA